MTAALDHPIYQELLAHLLELCFATTGQLARLTREHYGSSQSARRQTMRHLSKLEQHGQLLRLERRVGGWQHGSTPSVWALTTNGYRQATGHSGTRQRPNLISTTFLEHLLAIAETRIIAYETIRQIPGAELRVETEPACWRNYLGPHGERLTLRPDLLMSVTTPEYLDRYFIEVDRATENPTRVIAKCRQYVRYRRSGAEQRSSGAFPAVLWIVPTAKRRTQLRAHLEAAELPQGMFTVLTLDELPEIIRDGPPLTKQNNTRKENTPPMKAEHNSYPGTDAKNGTTPPATPERRAPPEPTTRQEARELDRLRREHGTAFDVYLDHVWNGIETITDMEADFNNLHWASYERIEQFVNGFIESLGWADARDHAIREWGIPNNILIFDRAAMFEQLRGDFEFHERGGEVHVFIR